ncbi:endonuclease VII domain-containing protein [Kocuria sp. CPCC 205316]|uniref:endonuclease VII domain-containing protein n=1 Tax=Kocuria TaxID=57493 RepID=UPI0036DB917E
MHVETECAGWPDARPLQRRGMFVSDGQEMCEFDGCDRTRAVKGWCYGHYGQLQRGNELQPLRQVGVVQNCPGPACTRDAGAVGLCKAHRAQQLKGEKLRPLRPRSRRKLPEGAASLRDSQGRKRCTGCLAWKPVTAVNFPKDRKQPDGLHPRCWECRRTTRPPALQRSTRLEKVYGITQEQYDATLEAQGGGCAICGREPNGASLAIDHDHNCCPGTGSCGGCIRGLLCGACNRGIGYLGDNAHRLRVATAYLENGPKPRHLPHEPDNDGQSTTETIEEDMTDNQD